MLHPDVLQIHAPAINFYVVRDDRGLTVIDGGFIGGPRRLTRSLYEAGWQNEPIRGIVVTHGHLED
ncbi:MBL fold metallo-hydrolase [Blastopirellula marina]|uniref:MBL fold metallo-hydrolase n=1 Tax=Blastopirellula marina TaxID=124 RepID=UPI001304B006|nr:MBL fold metallo-hydrolase [Blastopirellula marina]